MSTSLEWTPHALRDLKKLDVALRGRIVEALERYAQSGVGNVVQLTAIEPPEHRLRVGDWRVRFRRDSARATLVVLRVLPRDKAY
jgi:mRNA-degrading endonuclease RelE of RelBE toxin-antitoxin system